MKTRILASATLSALLIALATPDRLRAQHTNYKLIDIGTLGGPTAYESDSGFGNRILNNAGEIASSADTSIPDPNAPNFCFNPDCYLAHAVRWSDGVLTDLGSLSGNNSKAIAINARGWITGISPTDVIDPVTGGPINHAILWKDDEVVDLGTLGGNQSLGVYINNGGQVVGMSTVNTEPDPFSFFGAPTHPFTWKNGRKIDLGTLGGPDAFAGAGCVNQREDLVVGSSLTSSIPNPVTGFPTVDPFLWQNGKMINLGTLGGVFGFAQCANNRGQVIGQSDLSGDLTAHPFVWERGVLTDIGTLGGDFGTALWINDSGEVVDGPICQAVEYTMRFCGIRRE